ncbi:MAG: extracellular solute-binding protein [bacterium]
MKKINLLLSIVLTLTLLMGLTVFGASPNHPWPDAYERDERGVPQWPWEREEVEIDWFFSPSWYDFDWDTDALWPGIVTEETGISLNITVPPGDGGERLNAMIASGNLPDVITTEAWMPQYQLLRDSGLMEPLDPLFEKYAPGFLERYPQIIQDWYRADDGYFYAITNFFEVEPSVSMNPFFEAGNNFGMYVRGDLLDQIDATAEDFATEEGFINALRKFVEADIKTEDGQRIFPILAHAEVIGSIENMFGSNYAIPREDVEGNYADRRTHPRALEAIKFANRLVREGFIHPDNFTATDSQVKDWRDSGRFFLEMTGLRDISEDIVNQNDHIYYTPVEPLVYKEGEVPISTSSSTGWAVTLVNKEAENKEAIVRFIDYIFSNPIFDKFGIEGVSYNWREDGRLERTPEWYEFSEDQRKEEWGIDQFYWFRDSAIAKNYDIASVTPSSRGEAEARKVRQHFLEYLHVGADNPWMGIEPGGGDPEAVIQTSIDNYWEEQLTRMLVASSSEEVETLYNNAIEKMEKMGLDDLNDFMNEKFQANKELLGIEGYACPARKQAEGLL